MRKGIDGLAMLVQGVLRQDPFSGHLFLFRGRKANLIKIVFWDGCPYRKSNPDVLMVQTSEVRVGHDAANGLNSTRRWCILVQR